MRLAFRLLLGLTLVVLAVSRLTGGRFLSPQLLVLFYQWFAVSVFVFGVFGLRSAYLAWRDAANRKAYLYDVILAAAWVPYWYFNTR